MSSPMRPGTEDLKPDRHWHVFKGVDDKNGDINLYRKERLSFLTRASANQWSRLIEVKVVKQCKRPSKCTVKVFDPNNEVRTAGQSSPLSQGFVDQVNANAQLFDGGGLMLYVHPKKYGGLVRRWLFRAYLYGKSRQIRLGSAEALTLEEARVVAAKVMVEFVERRRLLSEGSDGDETNAAFLARMQQIAADAVEAAGLNATT